MPRDSMIIVGAGRAGSRAAQALREEGFSGRVVLIGEEPHPPYDRPPLSKERLFAQDDGQSGALYARDFFVERDIELRVGATARSIDRARHTLTLMNGEVLRYDRLLIATGAVSRKLGIPGAARPNIHSLRTLDDSRQLASQLHSSQRLTIIGGGLIGLEVAAGAAARGIEVVVLEASPRLIGRAAPERIAAAVQAAHEASGVRFVIDAAVSHLAGTDRVTAVHLQDGRIIDADLTLVAIGGAPRLELAEAAGLAVDSGIVTDSQLRTSDPDIYAAGDVASFVHPLFQRRLRLEHWHNAEEQGRHVAGNLLHAGRPYDIVPWFWSDQYDFSLQGAGIIDGEREAERSLPGGGLAVFTLDFDGRLIGATAFGPTGAVGRAISVARRLIAARLRVDLMRLSDPKTDLKKLLIESSVT